MTPEREVSLEKLLSTGIYDILLAWSRRNGDRLSLLEIAELDKGLAAAIRAAVSDPSLE